MQENTPFFSVIVPTYKRPVELHRAVQSIMRQTFSDFEILIVNNSDVEPVLSFQDNRIRILSEKRQGANYARNTGVENALAEFICFLDDDDEYLENHLETIQRLIIQNNKTKALYRTFTQVCKPNGECTDQHVSLKAANETVLEHLFTTMLVMHCVCVHRDILEQLKFDPSIPVAQDYHLWSRILTVHPLIETPVITTIYHKTENSTSSPGKEKYWEYIKVYKSLFQIPAIGSQLSVKLKTDRLFKYYYWLFCEFKNDLAFMEYVDTLFYMIYYKPSILFDKELYLLMLRKSKSNHT